MKLLAFDTSSKTGALAALEWEEGDARGRDGVRLMSEWSLNVDASFHSERLLWGIHQILDSCRWKLEDLNALAVGVGPGSFTGLRIGVTTARTLAAILSKPLIGVSSLAALARPAALWLSTQKRRSVIVASTDACKGELFVLCGSSKSVAECVAAPENGFNGLWKRGVEEKVLAPDEMIRLVKRKMKEGKAADWMAVGEGCARYAEAWRQLPSAKRIAEPLPFADTVQGRYVALLAWEAFQAGLLREPLSVHPRYLRASDAELKLEAGLLPPGPTRGGTA